MKKYLVGGAVRDKILNIKNNDKDWVIVGSDVDQMLKLGFKPVGKGFPVFLHPETKQEYALARTEKKISKGYYGFEFYCSKDVTLLEDLSRRDLTINAMAEDENGKIIDPFNGLNDIKLKILRHVSNAFIEDPLRVLRVARFSAKLDFKVADETMQLMKKIVLSGELKDLSKNLIFREISKGLMTNYPANMLKVFYESGALKFLMPEIYYLIEKELLIKKYNELLVVKSLNSSVKLNLNLASRYTCFCFYINKISDLNNLNNRLGVNNIIIKYTTLFNYFKDKFLLISNLNAKLILEILIKCNVFRQKDLFLDILNLCLLYYQSNCHNILYVRKWTTIINSVTSLKLNTENIDNIQDKIYKIRIDAIDKILLNK